MSTLCCILAQPQPDIVTISSGPIQGVRDESSNIRYWKGVPFAGPVSGENRFTAPVAPQVWSQPLLCDQFGPGCISSHHNLDTAPVQSEDCLNLNVYVPLQSSLIAKSNVTDTLLPVMFFMYGGGFAEGYNGGPLGMYDGSYIASQFDVIVVTINYRLGAYGFIVTDQLKGNYGFMDQQFALQWVQENIGTFGGDPSRVTIWGESAGAMSVGLHLISPQSQGLFSAAIMESNPLGLLFKANEHAQVYGMYVCELLGCNVSSTQCDSDCLRASSTHNFTEAWAKSNGDAWVYILANWGHLGDGFLEYTPTIDGNLIPSEVVPMLQSGKFAKVPIMLGTNTNEGETFIDGGDDSPLPMYLFDLLVDLNFASGSKQILAYYGQFNYTDAHAAISQLFTDYEFACSSQLFATAAQSSSLKSFVYRYSHVLSDVNLVPITGLPAICAKDVCHAAELPFVFHFMNVSSPVLNMTLTPEEYELSQTMVTYWTNFAKYGDPNGDGSSKMKSSSSRTTLMQWPQWDVNTRQIMVLNTTMEIDSQTSLVTCANLWDQIGYNF